MRRAWLSKYGVLKYHFDGTTLAAYAPKAEE
jgi:hypothetical protein